jgi:hypothetical protein
MTIEAGTDPAAGEMSWRYRAVTFTDPIDGKSPR